MKVVLAHTTYQASVDVQERLTRYVLAMRQALSDPAVAADVEQRMVDILEEQDIRPGHTIPAEAVRAIEAIMGDPAAFTEIDVQQMALYHRRLSALQLVLRFSGVGLLLAAATVLVLLLSAVLSLFGKDATDSFPSGVVEWVYAVAGGSTMAVFSLLGTLAGICLLQGRLTPRGRHLLRSAGIAGLGMVATVIVSAIVIIATN
jgi:hypothetical protein